MQKIVLVLAAVLYLPGCAILETTPLIGTDEISRNIGENASKLNDAQSRALNGVILQNILRARDRWPKHYTTLSGITSEPQVTLNLGAEFAPIGLGNPPLPFGDSSVSGSQDSTAALSYKSNPLERNDNAYEPIPHELFARYWNDGWPKDVLLLLLVKSISIGDHRYENTTASQDKVEEYWRAVSSLLSYKQCQYLLSANLGLDNVQTMTACKEEVIRIRDDGVEIRSGLRRFPDDPCRRERHSAGNTVTSNVSDRCSLKYVKRIETPREDECPVAERFGRLHLINNRDAGAAGLLAQIEKLRVLYDGKVHLVRNKTSPLGDVFEVRLCNSMKRDDGYEFVRLDEQKAEEFFGLPEGKQFQDKTVRSEPQVAYTRWSNVSLELRSFDDILNYLGELLRNADTNGLSTVDRFVLKSGRCKAAQEAYGKDFDPELRQRLTMRLFSAVDKDVAENAIDSVFRVRENQFAVKTEHAGTIYLAVERPNGGVDADCDLDRTSAVFALLSQIYIRSQSAAFLRAPEGGRVRTQ